MICRVDVRDVLFDGYCSADYFEVSLQSMALSEPHDPVFGDLRRGSRCDKDVEKDRREQEVHGDSCELDQV